MIRIPKLSKQQLKDLEDLKDHEGFKIIQKAIEHTVRTNDLELANYDFSVSRKPEDIQQRAREFSDTQKTNILLKSFLMFLSQCHKYSSEQEIELDKQKDVYE